MLVFLVSLAYLETKQQEKNLFSPPTINGWIYHVVSEDEFDFILGELVKKWWIMSLEK